MIYSEMQRTLHRLQSQGVVVLPYGVVPQPKGVMGDQEITESDWLSWSWNPPEGNSNISEPDPDASPKPTWQFLVEAVRSQNIENFIHAESMRHNEFEYDRDVRLRRAIDSGVAVRGKELHPIAEGFGHTESMLAMVEHATIAGRVLPRTEISDADGERVSVHSNDHMREVVLKAAELQNVGEMAHGSWMASRKLKLSILEDESKSYGEREAAAAELQRLRNEYAAEIKARMAKVDTTSLPTNLDDLKEVLAERLEAVATAHIKAILNAAAQQGMDPVSYTHLTLPTIPLV